MSPPKPIQSTALIAYIPPKDFSFQFKMLMERMQDIWMEHSLAVQQTELRLLHPYKMPVFVRQKKPTQEKPTENIQSTKGPSLSAYSKPSDFSNEEWKMVMNKMEEFFGYIACGQKTKYAEVIEINNLDPILVWPTGDAIRLTGCVVGRGLTKTVYEAIDLKNGKTYAASFATCNEIDSLKTLQNKRGIVQMYNHSYVRINGKYGYFFYGELYDTDLQKALYLRCSLHDLQIVVKDLVYALMALEGEAPNGDWIDHGDIKDANVFLRKDKTTCGIISAYLGDFGCSGKHKTVEIDEETFKRDIEETGFPRYAHRESQRERFISTIFHQIKNYLEKRLKRSISLTDLCASDPVCAKFMEEMEKKYASILEQRYFHIAD